MPMFCSTCDQMRRLAKFSACWTKEESQRMMTRRRAAEPTMASRPKEKMAASSRRRRGDMVVRFRRKIIGRVLSRIRIWDVRGHWRFGLTI